ncbi:MAG TPA: amino acid permease [Planctomycetota bacterium]|nr:amino acid permease [Planctomycetota bacterium]
MVVVREVGFRSELGLFDVVTLIMGSMIGSGIFILPALMAADVGSAPLVLLAWIAGAVLTICGALTFAEMAAVYPKAGGQYAYLRETLGPLWSFLFGWQMLLAIQTAIIAAVAVAFATFADYFFDLPGTAHELGFLTLPKWGLSFTAVAIIWFLTAVNYLGVKRGAFVQNVSTVMKVAALVFIVAAVFIKGQPAGNYRDLGTALGAAGIGTFGIALTRSLFAYDGWPQATYVAAEVKDPNRVVPRALLLGVGGVALVYILATAAYFHVLPFDEASGAARISADAAAKVVGSSGAALVAGAVMVSTFGTVNGYILTSPRVFYAVAKDGAFPAAFARLSEHRTPTYGLWYVAVWSSLLALSGTYAELTLIVVFSLWFFYIPTAIGYFRKRRANPELFTGFRMPLYPLPAILFILSAFYVVGNTILQDFRTAAFSFVVMALGVPVYYAMKIKGEVAARASHAGDAPTPPAPPMSAGAPAAPVPAKRPKRTKKPPTD